MQLRESRVIVIGSGIAGLSAGFRLKQKGCDVQVLEREAYPGGRMRTVDRDGYRIDVAASVLSTSYKQMLALIADAGLTGQIQPTSEVMGVLRDSKVHRLQGLGLRSMLRTDLFSARSKLLGLRCLADLKRCFGDELWYDLSSAQTEDNESVWSYASRRMPKEIRDFLIDPMCRSIYLAPSEEVSKLSLLFFLTAMAGKSFFGSADGVGFLTKGLAKQLDVRYEAMVHAVEEVPGGVKVHWSKPGGNQQVEHASAAVIALPATQVPAVFNQLTKEQKAFLQTPIYSPTMVISVGLEQAPPNQDVMWLNISRSDSEDLNAIVMDHNKAPKRAPAGKGLITTFWMREWSQQRWEEQDEKLGEEAFAKARRLLPSMKDNVDMVDVRRINPGASVRAPGGYQALARFMSAYDPNSRVHLAGDYLTSISTNGSLCSGERAASRVAGALLASKR